MKQTPDEKKIQEKMQPGSITLEGFLGNDNRHYHEIIEEDLHLLNNLGITKEQIADKLQDITDQAFESYDGIITLENGAIVEYVSVRGKVVSPFSGQKPSPKGFVKYYDPQRKISISWCPLNIQMIREFGFFEGKGSPNRLDPDLIFKLFFA
ncbi:MAG: hypothetical protein K9M99_06385 [Candidatus Cloacimonetes bacterium]|nr:hypothetical protein [Candidatus Cloacimonadota bacterium]